MTRLILTLLTALALQQAVAAPVAQVGEEPPYPTSGISSGNQQPHPTGSPTGPGGFSSGTGFPPFPLPTLTASKYGLGVRDGVAHSTGTGPHQVPTPTGIPGTETFTPPFPNPTELTKTAWIN